MGYLDTIPKQGLSQASAKSQAKNRKGFRLLLTCVRLRSANRTYGHEH